MPIVTKLIRMVAYLKKFSPLKPRKSLIMWSCDFDFFLYNS